MNRIPSLPPLIPALGKNSNRPLWSIMIPVYNCAQFIPDVLECVLRQDMGSEYMQIEVVDDASTDGDIATLVKKLGKGRVKYFRQPENVGNLRNFETCINRAQGKLVHLLHGDDRVRDGYYKKMTDLFEKFPEAGAAFSNYSFINKAGNVCRDFFMDEKADGILKDWLIRIASYQKIQYAGMVVKREVYEHLGSFYGINYGEDWEMWVRIAKFYPVAFTPDVLAEYRGHIGSITWTKVHSGQVFHDMKKIISLNQELVPKNEKARILRRSKIHCAHQLIGMANMVWRDTRNLDKAHKLIKQSLIFNSSSYVLGRIGKFYFKVLAFKITRSTSKYIEENKMLKRISLKF